MQNNNSFKNKSKKISEFDVHMFYQLFELNYGKQYFVLTYEQLKKLVFIVKQMKLMKKDLEYFGKKDTKYNLIRTLTNSILSLSKELKKDNIYNDKEFKLYNVVNGQLKRLYDDDYNNLNKYRFIGSKHQRGYLHKNNNPKISKKEKINITENNTILVNNNPRIISKKKEKIKSESDKKNSNSPKFKRICNKLIKKNLNNLKGNTNNNDIVYIKDNDLSNTDKIINDDFKINPKSSLSLLNNTSQNIIKGNFKKNNLEKNKINDNYTNKLIITKLTPMEHQQIFGFIKKSKLEDLKRGHLFIFNSDKRVQSRYFVAKYETTNKNITLDSIIENLNTKNKFYPINEYLVIRTEKEIIVYIDTLIKIIFEKVNNAKEKFNIVIKPNIKLEAKIYTTNTFKSIIEFIDKKNINFITNFDIIKRYLY